jgi:hypothetical protein
VLFVIVNVAAAASAAAQGQPAPAAPVPQTPVPQAPAPQQPPAGGAQGVTPAPAGAQVPPPVPVAAVAPPVPGTVTCPAPVPPATIPARSFTANAGMLFHQVIPARIGDFDRFLAYVRDALAKSTNATVRKQAAGWTFYRTVEAGPNGDALYVFFLNPAVPCVDYALGPILAEAYPDPAQLMEIWKLYTSSVRPTGSSLLTLVPAPVVPLTPPLTPPTTPAKP